MANCDVLSVNALYEYYDWNITQVISCVHLNVTG